MKTTSNSLNPINAPQPRSRWFYSTLFALAGICLWQAAPRSVRATKFRLSQFAVAAQATRTSPTNTKRDLETRHIQNIRTGMKVLGENPELAGVEIEEETMTPDTHRNVVLIANKPDGGQVEMTLLRSLDWIEEFGAEVSRTIDLTLTEIETAETAEVVAIEPCPPLEGGPGHFVTGTFKHTAANVVDLYIEGLDKPIGTTSNHRFWSDNRVAFVTVGELNVGDNLVMADHSIDRVIARTVREQPEAVYNLEVARQHVYLVGPTGILVHNTYGVSGSGPGHHIASRYDNLNRGWSRPWSMQSKQLLRDAKINVESTLNKVHLPGHSGPHPELYHRRVYERLSDAATGLSGDALTEALENELEAIANDLLADVTRLSGVGL